MNNEQLSKQVYTCFHCGNTGLLKYIGKTGWKTEDVQFNEYDEICNYILIEHEDWFAYSCPVCKKPILISEYQFDADSTAYPIVTIQYPSLSISKEGVPNDIYSAYEAAVKTKGIDFSICLLSLRRVLEMICKDKGANGKNLESMIADLVQKKELSPMMDDACWIIRQLGNDAAHADKIKVYQYEIEQVIKYLANIIDYLYSMPYQVAKMKEDIKNQKKRKSESVDEDVVI